MTKNIGFDKIRCKNFSYRPQIFPSHCFYCRFWHSSNFAFVLSFSWHDFDVQNKLIYYRKIVCILNRIKNHFKKYTFNQIFSSFNIIFVFPSNLKIFKFIFSRTNEKFHIYDSFSSIRCNNNNWIVEKVLSPSLLISQDSVQRSVHSSSLNGTRLTSLETLPTATFPLHRTFI